MAGGETKDLVAFEALVVVLDAVCVLFVMIILDRNSKHHTTRRHRLGGFHRFSRPTQPARQS